MTHSRVPPTIACRGRCLVTATLSGASNESAAISEKAGARLRSLPRDNL